MALSKSDISRVQTLIARRKQQGMEIASVKACDNNGEIEWIMQNKKGDVLDEGVFTSTASDDKEWTQIPLV